MLLPSSKHYRTSGPEYCAWSSPHTEQLLPKSPETSGTVPNPTGASRHVCLSTSDPDSQVRFGGPSPLASAPCFPLGSLVSWLRPLMRRQHQGIRGRENVELRGQEPRKSTPEDVIRLWLHNSIFKLSKFYF